MVPEFANIMKALLLGAATSLCVVTVVHAACMPGGPCADNPGVDIRGEHDSGGESGSGGGSGGSTPSAALLLNKEPNALYNEASKVAGDTDCTTQQFAEHYVQKLVSRLANQFI
jgi:hypothetical protein